MLLPFPERPGDEPPRSPPLSLWILGQFNASPHTTVFIPYRQGTEVELGPVVEADDFGTVPADLLKVGDGIIRFRVDGHFRSKLGLDPRRALPVMAESTGVTAP